MIWPCCLCLCLYSLTVVRQRLGEHVPVAKNKQATIEKNVRRVDLYAVHGDSTRLLASPLSKER
jgi:hypothetical protein